MTPIFRTTGTLTIGMVSRINKSFYFLNSVFIITKLQSMIYDYIQHHNNILSETGQNYIINRLITRRTICSSYKTFNSKNKLYSMLSNIVSKDYEKRT